MQVADPDSHAIDGSLARWSEIAEAAAWNALLLGNGLSINVSRDFDYESLHKRACDLGLLTDEDVALFETWGTRNFELVEGRLQSAIQAADALNLDSGEFSERYRSVRAALGAAVQGVHPDRSDVPDGALATLREEMRKHKVVFTTSYDLLAYWAMGYNEDFANFVDCFWYGDFSPPAATGRLPVYFLHGALHLIVTGDGNTKKLKRDDQQTLLEQFGQPIPDDPQARPLLVSEGSPRDKARAIANNDYLSHSLKCLADCSDPLIVFGHRLSNEDQHLLEAINEHRHRPVAVSLTPGEPIEVMKKQAALRGAIHCEPLRFFSSESHALGDPKLSKPKRSWRRPFARRG